MNSNDLNRVRLQLLALGYHIIPNKGKVPAAKGWNRPDFIVEEMTPARVESWLERFVAPTIGVIVQGGLCIIDVDVDDILIDRLIGDIDVIAPEVCWRAPTRFGGGDYKIALFCRTEDDFVRVASRKYNGHCVEIFGGGKLKNGNFSRQFGVYGPHSFNADGSVAVDYAWSEGTRELADLAVKDLPLLSRDQALEICGAFERLAEAAGWVAEQKPEVDHAGAVYDIDEASRFNTDRAGAGLTYAELCEAYEAVGELRCASSFMTGRDGRDRSRCWVYWSKRCDCVAVYVYGDEATHYPKSVATPDKPLLPGVKSELPAGIGLKDFYAYLPNHSYLFTPTGDLWPLASINSRLPSIPLVDSDGRPLLDTKRRPRSLKPSTWLDQNRSVEQMSWAPGEPEVLVDRLATEGGWIVRAGTATFNLYKPPRLSVASGSPARWLDLVRMIYGDHVDHIVRFCAHRIQRPAEKINHALVLTGSPGIGKDTLLEPLKYGVGPWNFKEVSPQNIMEKYNDFVRSVVLRISEARDLGDVNRYAMYEAMKTLAAAPPDMLRCEVKYTPQYYVPNVTAVIITTNYPGDGLYLPADDRRHYVCGTEVTSGDFSEGFWREIWAWYAGGGLADVVGYLKAYDLSDFDAKRPPVKTEAFLRMVDAGRSVEEPDMLDAIEAAGNPNAVAVIIVAAYASHELKSWLLDVRNRRAIPHRFESCGYLPVRNKDNKSGLWVIGTKRQVVYCKRELSVADRYNCAAKLAKEWRDKMISGNVTPFKPR